MALLRTSWAVVTLVTSVCAAYKGIPAGDHVDTRRAEIGRDYRDKLSRDSMIHFVYPIEELSKFLQLYELCVLNSRITVFQVIPRTLRGLCGSRQRFITATTRAGVSA